jgi:hypothetical protein
MDLSLNDAERAHLASLGVTVGTDGTMRSESGREVSAGTAVQLLSKAAISPADFQRGYLREGHAAENTGQWITGIPPYASPVSAEGPAARTGRAGPAGPVGSGTADRDMVPGDDLAKGMAPQRFMRPYLAGGHQVNSPAVTGMRGTTAVPDSHHAEPQDYQRGWITPGHEQDSPDARPGNNPHAVGTPGSEVYRSAAAVYEANQTQLRTEHVMPSQNIPAQTAAVRPAAMPSDMRASDVPAALQVGATRPAPGEVR